MSNYWNTEVTDNLWLSINCPVMEEGNLSFGVKRRIVEELREIEAQIMNNGLTGWVGHTELKNPHIMIMLRKLGAVPYELQDGKLWFKKEIP